MKTLPQFFRTDFSSETEFLNTLPLGPLSQDNAESLANVIDNHDESDSHGQWNALGDDSPFCLSKSEVIFAGHNNVDLPTHPLFTHVVGISLPSDEDGGRRMYLHYNQ